MHKRKRALLCLINSLNERKIRIGKTLLVKLLFILRQEYGIGDMIKFYNFYPYRYGPFSNMFYLDLSDIQSNGLINEAYSLAPEAITAAQMAPKPVRDSILSLVERFDGKDIIAYVYGKYPEYTIKSELLANDQKSIIFGQHCNEKATWLSKLQYNEEKKETPGLFTIGYQGKDLDMFLDTLIQNKIGAVIDVRANPFSMNFSFIGKRLKTYLEKVGIEYRHIPELGIPGEQRKNLNSVADYEKLFEFYKAEILPRQKENIKQLAEMAAKKRVALLCFEEDKNCCHRGVLSEELERFMWKRATHV